MSTTTVAKSVRSVSAAAGADAILKVLREDGSVVIKGLFTADQVGRINKEIQPAMDKLEVGSKVPDDYIKSFHGANTKRLTGLVTLSKTFREEVMDNDLLHELCEKVFAQDSGTYWLNTAQVIEIGPGSMAQDLHRDQWQYPVFTHCGPSAPEALINFMLALTPFTEENGATRVIPGSHKWKDFTQNGTQEDTSATEMDPGDVCCLSGKVVHGGGANRTADYWRRGLVVIYQPSYLTLEEAHPFLVKKELVDTLSPRAQSMIGFRSQFPKNSPGVWKRDYSDANDILHAWIE